MLLGGNRETARRPHHYRPRKKGSVVDNIPDERWARLERIAALLKPTTQGFLSLSDAKELAKQLGVHWTTVYKYRRRLNSTAETTAIAGRKKGWKSKTPRLLPDQEQAINEAIAGMRRKRRAIGLVDVVNDFHARCRLLNVLPPSRPAIDRRLRQTTGLIIERRGEALPGESDPRVAPGTFRVCHRLTLFRSTIRRWILSWSMTCFVCLLADRTRPWQWTWRRAAFSRLSLHLTRPVRRLSRFV